MNKTLLFFLLLAILLLANAKKDSEKISKAKEKQKEKNEQTKKKKKELNEKRNKLKEESEKRKKNKVSTEKKFKIDLKDVSKFLKRLKMRNYAKRYYFQSYGQGAIPFYKVCACFNPELCMKKAKKDFGKSSILDNEKSDIRKAIKPNKTNCNAFDDMDDDAKSFLDSLKCDEDGYDNKEDLPSNCVKLDKGVKNKEHRCSDVIVTTNGGSFGKEKKYKPKENKDQALLRFARRVWCDKKLCLKTRYCILAKNWLLKKTFRDKNNKDKNNKSKKKNDRKVNEKDKKRIENLKTKVSKFLENEKTKRNNGDEDSVCTQGEVDEVDKGGETNKTITEKNGKVCKVKGKFRFKGCALKRLCKKWFDNDYKTKEGKCLYFTKEIDMYNFSKVDLCSVEEKDVPTFKKEKKFYLHCCKGDKCNENVIDQDQRAAKCKKDTNIENFYEIVHKCYKKHSYNFRKFLRCDDAGKEIKAAVDDKKNCDKAQDKEEDLTSEKRCKFNTCHGEILQNMLDVNKCVCEENKDNENVKKFGKFYQFMLRDRYGDYCPRVELNCKDKPKRKRQFHIIKLNLKLNLDAKVKVGTNNEEMINKLKEVFNDNFYDKYCDATNATVTDQEPTDEDPLSDDSSISEETRRRLAEGENTDVYYNIESSAPTSCVDPSEYDGVSINSCESTQASIETDADDNNSPVQGVSVETPDPKTTETLSSALNIFTGKHLLMLFSLSIFLF